MGKLILKNIHCTLDPASLKKAAKEIEDLANGLVDGLAELARYLTEERGVGIAKMYIGQFPAVDTGALHDSIHGNYDKGNHNGKILAGEGLTDGSGTGSYAIYVEYGTGIVGAQNNHPEPIGDYDIHHHGEAGWYYKDETGWHWTKGMPARPFMYYTFRELEGIAMREGGRIIAEYIP